MKIIRSILAVLGGYGIIVLITTIGFTWLLGNPDFYRGSGVTRLLGGVVAVVAGLAGGFAAGRIAPARPFLHAALVVIPIVMDSSYVFFVWRPRQPQPAPLWFEAIGSLTLIFATLVGGWIASHRTTSRTAAHTSS